MGKSFPEIAAMASLCMAVAVTFSGAAVAAVDVAQLQEYKIAIPPNFNGSVTFPANFSNSSVIMPLLATKPIMLATVMPDRTGRSLDTNTNCRAIEARDLSGSVCVLSDCTKYRKIECNSPTEMDVQVFFGNYLEWVKQKQQSPGGLANVPLYFKLAGGTLNLTANLLYKVAGLLGKVEFYQTNFPAVANDAFSGLANVTSVKLDGVVMNEISGGLLQGLGDTLQSLTLKNLTTLTTVQPNAFDPLIKSTSLKCLNINVASSKFSCNCNNGTSAWLQRTLNNISLTSTGNASLAWQDMYADSDSPWPSKSVKCEVNLICSNSSSVADFRLTDVMDVNIPKACPPPTPPPATTAAPPPATTVKAAATTPKSTASTNLASFSTFAIFTVALLAYL